MIFCYFTPLKIYNGTPFGRPTRDSRATLPINELKVNPPMADCPILNLQGCKIKCRNKSVLFQ